MPDLDHFGALAVPTHRRRSILNNEKKLPKIFEGRFREITINFVFHALVISGAFYAQ